MERRKFLQLIGVGLVTAVARLTTGGDGGDEEQPALPEPENPQEGPVTVYGGGLRGGKSHAQMQQVIKDHKPGQRVLKYNGIPATIEFSNTPEDPDSWQCIKSDPVVTYTLGRSVHYRFQDDQELWKLKRRHSSWQGPLPPGFVILKPSKEMVEELKDLKAAEISILARYTDD